MKQLIRTLLIIIAFIPLTIAAQNYSAKTSLDSTQFLIGDHITIHLEVTAPKGEPVEIPQLNQEIFEANHLPYDWISNSPIDTSSKKSQDIYKQDITIIAFDSGHYYFPQLAILSTDSQLLAQTDLLQFDITTIPVDTTAEFKDIKPITETTMGWHEFWIYVKEYLPYIIIIILVIALIAYLIYQMVKKHKQRPKVASAKPAKPKVKPHITALRALEHLRKKKLWEQGKVKDYYSELTDIVRVYIEGRWNVNAKEMVSNEIIEELSQLPIPDEQVEMLKKSFQTADLVKFAKWDPLPDDHNYTYKCCKEFVEQTAEQNDTNVNNEKK